MIPFRRAVTTVALLLGTIIAGAQTRTVVLSGYVRDAESGEPLPQAVVYLEDKKTGVAADGVGFYSLHVPTGNHTVYCSYFRVSPRTASDSTPCMFPRETTPSTAPISGMRRRNSP